MGQETAIGNWCSADIKSLLPRARTLLDAVSIVSSEGRTGSTQSYSMTSSARASNSGGTSRFSEFAVFTLMTSWNFVGCSTGSNHFDEIASSHCASDEIAHRAFVSTRTWPVALIERLELHNRRAVIAADPEADRRRRIVDEDPPDIGRSRQEIIDHFAGPRVEPCYPVCGH
jgi:hypothetical protein